ncbi:MAG: alpha/beta fold hydrolase [Dehalococcoidia bacterium]|jgi:alpha-beta hydrolase superfamily lysophospholipase|nr:alpha/beta fold hydrolase [Dehalococcoidia bacterium]
MIWWLLLGSGVFVLLAYGATALYIAELFTRSKRRRVEGTPAAFGLRFEEIQLRAPDGVVLRGWFLDSPGARATVVLVHDGEGTRADSTQGLLALQRDYVLRGFNVFAFDLRGRGESAGVRDRLGSAEQRDVAVAIAYVRRRAGELPIVLHGFGLGGSLAISTVAAGAPADVLIADSPFSSARDHLRFRWHRLPGHIFHAACWVARRVYGADVDALSPQNVICDVAPTPVLLVHGDADEVVPVEDTLNIAAATLQERIDLWVVPGSGHCRAYVEDPRRYLGRCLAFIDEAIPRRVLASAG